MSGCIIAIALAILPHDWPEFEEVVHTLMHHPDEGVNSRAILWLRASVLGPATRRALRQRVRVNTGAVVDPNNLAAPNPLTAQAGVRVRGDAEGTPLLHQMEAGVLAQIRAAVSRPRV